jgi:uncharacterized protein YciI
METGEDGMTRRFVFFYFMKASSDRIRDTVPLHVQYWKTRDLNGYSGGPFSDRTGGLITFEATNLETAAELVTADPFVTQNLIETKWVKEWLAE